jgi:hypothetical protein
VQQLSFDVEFVSAGYGTVFEWSFKNKGRKIIVKLNGVGGSKSLTYPTIRQLKNLRRNLPFKIPHK